MKSVMAGAKAVNVFGVAGAISSAEVNLARQANPPPSPSLLCLLVPIFGGL